MGRRIYCRRIQERTRPHLTDHEEGCCRSLSSLMASWNSLVEPRVSDRALMRRYVRLASAMQSLMENPNDVLPASTSFARVHDREKCIAIQEIFPSLNKLTDRVAQPCVGLICSALLHNNPV